MLWQPAADAWERTQLGRFLAVASARWGRALDDYPSAWAWSVERLDEFWWSVWDWHGVRASGDWSRVLDRQTMPGTRWFSGARLNFAEHALAQSGCATAVVARSDSRAEIALTWDDLRSQVGRARWGLQALGVRPGDRVAGYLPNVPEALVAFLATASLGAIWTSCAPEFGVRAVLDRLEQVEPVVLLTVSGYRYGAKYVSRVNEVADIRKQLPSVRALVEVPYGDGPLAADLTWEQLLAHDAAARFERVPFDHPLYILYSSGTTGRPKPIVHGHGGILLEHAKVLGLHADLSGDDRFFWFSTTGWMMWNLLVSGLLVGASIVLFDGDPVAQGPATLWQLAAETATTWCGMGAPSIMAGARAGLHPGSDADLSRLRAVGSTGSPLPPAGYRWVYDAVHPEVMLSSISGGTDICSAFVGASPLTPVWEGEIPCRYLGAAVAAFDEHRRPVVGIEGELVVTKPMPSMPVGFWGDTDGSRYRAAYFDEIPGVWRHGDWITLTERGSCVIAGRSDATLNRGGVRVGTAEMYRVVEQISGIRDSLVVHLTQSDVLVLLVALDASVELDPDAVRAEIRAQLSPRHVPDEIHVVDAIPTTMTGKKLELPVKRMLEGAPPDPAVIAAARDPRAIEEVVALATRRLGSASDGTS